MERKHAQEILDIIGTFSEPITLLSEALEKIDNDEDRRRFRRVLGEVMGLLDGEIDYPIRKRFALFEAD